MAAAVFPLTLTHLHSKFHRGGISLVLFFVCHKVWPMMWLSIHIQFNSTCRSTFLFKFSFSFILHSRWLKNFPRTTHVYSQYTLDNYSLSERIKRWRQPVKLNISGYSAGAKITNRPLMRSVLLTPPIQAHMNSWRCFSLHNHSSIILAGYWYTTFMTITINLWAGI